MANNNLYLRCLICSPRKGEPVDWESEIKLLHYFGSFIPGSGWFTKRESEASNHLNGWLEKHSHEDVTEDAHFEIVDESQPARSNARLVGDYSRMASVDDAIHRAIVVNEERLGRALTHEEKEQVWKQVTGPGAMM